MAKDKYDVLADQIGDAGKDTTEGNKGKGLGELKHKKEVLGQREDLDTGEKESLKEFNEKIDRLRVAKSAPISQGWIPVDRSEMGIRGMFYPAEWEFMIKPATVSMIKAWTSIDESNPQQVSNVLNEICKTCVKINTGSATQGAGWAQINSWDRFWFILKIREATFVDGETRIEYQDECSECGEPITYELTADHLFYEFPDEDLIEKYWDGEKWNIDPKEYGVDHEPITLYTPKLGKDQAIIDWAVAKARNNQKVDEVFVNFLVWMMPKQYRDIQMLDRVVDRLYKEYRAWSVDMFEFMDDVIRNITINPSEKLHQVCPACERMSESSVRFPNGIKYLFKTQTKVKKFGSR